MYPNDENNIIFLNLGKKELFAMDPEALYQMTTTYSEICNYYLLTTYN